MRPEVWLRIRSDFTQWLPAIIAGEDRHYPYGWAQDDLPPTSIKATAEYVAFLLRLRLSDILGDSQQPQIRRARLLLYRLVRDRHPNVSLSRIAGRLGRHHSSITHGLDKARDLLKRDPEFRSRYDALRLELS